MKKRLVLSLFSILLVSLLLSPHTFAQETPETVVRVAPRPLLSENDSHLVDIVIENGQAVTGYQVMLQYDSDYIEYVDIDHGNYLPDDAFFGDAQMRDTNPNDSLKAILFTATAFPNQSEGDGVLATLTFKTIIAEPSDLTLLDVTRLSHDVNVVDNTVTISSPQLENSRTYPEALPDLVVEFVPPSKSTAIPGRNFQLTAILKNRGHATATAPIRYRWFQSILMDGNIEFKEIDWEELTTERLDANDLSVPMSIRAEQTAKRNIFLQAPEDSGTYQYLVCVDSIDNESDPGNNCSDTVEITVDHGDTPAEATPLPLDDSLSGEIQTPSDVDYFKVEVSNSGRLSLSTAERPNMEIELQDSDGSPMSVEHVLEDNDGGTRWRIINYEVDAGPHYIRITAPSNMTGSYEFIASFTSTTIQQNIPNTNICNIFLNTVIGDPRKVGRVAYSPDGTVLAAGDEDNHFHFWGASTGEHLHTDRAEGNIYGMAFSPGRPGQYDRGKWFAIGTDGGKLWLWERDPAKTWFQTFQILGDSSLPDKATITVPTPSGWTLAGYPNDITSVAFSHDGERLAIGTGRHDIFVSEYNSGTWDDWDDNTLLIPANESIVRSLAFHPTASNILASGYEDGKVRIWDLSDYKKNVPNPQVLSGNYNAPVYSIAFSSTGDYLAIAGMFQQTTQNTPVQPSITTSHRISLWRRQNNQWVNHTYLPTDGRHDTDVLSVAFAPSADVLLSGDADGNIHAWRVPLGAHLGLMNDYGFSNISSIAFNSQGNAVAFGTAGTDDNKHDGGGVHQFTFDVNQVSALAQANASRNERPKVRVIYYYPSDKKMNNSTRSRVPNRLEKAQKFFKTQMAEKGYGGKTFLFETDTNNDLVVHEIQSQQYTDADLKKKRDTIPASTISSTILNDLEFGPHSTPNAGLWYQDPNRGQFDRSTDIYLVILQLNKNGPCGYEMLDTIQPTGKQGLDGFALVYMDCFGDTQVTLEHELGHAFGLGHNFRSGEYLMSYGDTGDNPFNEDRGLLSSASAHWLAVHPAFMNTGVCDYSHANADSPTTISITHPSISITYPSNNADITYIYPKGTSNFSLKVSVSDPNGIHQIQLFVPVTGQEPVSATGYKLRTWGKGKHHARANWSFDISDLLGNKNIIRLYLQSIDNNGNIAYAPRPDTESTVSLEVVTLIKAERADVDGNGHVGREDVAIIEEILSSREPFEAGVTNANADVNDDNKVNSYDKALVEAVIDMEKDAANAPARIQVSLLPQETALLVNYPNPFNPETWIPYQLATHADVTLKIYDIQGHVVRDLDLGHQHAGMYQSKSRAAYWDGKNIQGESVASGVYFYTLTAGDFSATRRMLILK